MHIIAEMLSQIFQWCFDGRLFYSSVQSFNTKKKNNYSQKNSESQRLDRLLPCLPLSLSITHGSLLKEYVVSIRSFHWNAVSVWEEYSIKLLYHQHKL